MRILQKTKDGGPESPVDAYFLCEFKGLLSVAILKFNEGMREKYHNHAFNAWTWFLSGDLTEQHVSGLFTKYKRSFFPKKTSRHHMHRVLAGRTSWCLTIRGPWLNSWQEFDEEKNEMTTLTHGRKKI